MKQQSGWQGFAVIARRWEDLEPFAALCRLNGTPVRLLREEEAPSLHETREGHHLLTLLKGEKRSAPRPRVLLRPTTLSRWFQQRYRQRVEELIESPQRAALAQFIQESETVAPGTQRVAFDLVESVYEFKSGRNSTVHLDNLHGPIMLLTAHRAKGLEFDHVLILDAGGWGSNSDEERRLFYVAMTRARKTLTVCARFTHRHPFIDDCAELCLKSRPTSTSSDSRLGHRTWIAGLEHIVLSWPGYSPPEAPIHQALAELDYGDELRLQRRGDGNPGWEIANKNGIVVARMAKKFNPPDGQIIGVRVAAILVREPRSEEVGKVRCSAWELVLPEIEYVPQSAAVTHSGENSLHTQRIEFVE